MNSEPSTVKSGRFSSVRVQEVPDMDPVEDAPSTLAHQTISRPEQNALQLQGNKADQSALTTWVSRKRPWRPKASKMAQFGSQSVAVSYLGFHEVA